jgi:hypothetical protein
LSNLKIALSGAYHAIKFETYAKRYLAEFQYRFNRRFNPKTLLQRLTRAVGSLNIDPSGKFAWLKFIANQDKFFFTTGLRTTRLPRLGSLSFLRDLEHVG